MPLLMSRSARDQAAEATLDWSVDWTGDLIFPEVILTSIWSARQVAGRRLSFGPLLTDQGLDVAAQIARVLISAGIAGTTWRVTNRITTTTGRVDAKAFDLTFR